MEKEIRSSYDKYLRSAVEIFARGFEVYVAHTVGIRCICKSKTKLRKNLLLYPSGRKGIETIIKFFDQYLAAGDLRRWKNSLVKFHLYYDETSL